MSLDYFRVLKGIQLDESCVIVTGSSDPSVVGYAASEGSLYLQDAGITGTFWFKFGPANTDWSIPAGTMLHLYKETYLAEVAPVASGTNSVAIGSASTASAQDAMAHGTSATASGIGSIALG